MTLQRMLDAQDAKVRLFCTSRWAVQRVLLSLTGVGYGAGGTRHTAQASVRKPYRRRRHDPAVHAAQRGPCGAASPPGLHAPSVARSLTPLVCAGVNGHSQGMALSFAEQELRLYQRIRPEEFIEKVVHPGSVEAPNVKCRHLVAMISWANQVRPGSWAPTTAPGQSRMPVRPPFRPPLRPPTPTPALAPSHPRAVPPSRLPARPCARA